MARWGQLPHLRDPFRQAGCDEVHVALWPRVQRHEVADADVIADLRDDGEQRLIDRIGAAASVWRTGQQASSLRYALP